MIPFHWWFVLYSLVFSINSASLFYTLTMTQDKAWSTLTGVALNVISSLAAHYLIFTENGDDSADSDQSESDDILCLGKIRDIMRGISEPVTKWGGVLVWMTFVPTLMMVSHWIGDVDSDLIDEYGREYAEKLIYNGEIRNVIGGLPDYFFLSIMWCVVAIITGIAATWQWDVDVQESPTDSGHVASESMEDVIAGESKNGVSTSEIQTEMMQLTADEAGGNVTDK